MKTLYVFLAAACAFVLGGCTNEMESGKGYPALETGDATLVFKLDKVMQNDTDVKPYFDFFDGLIQAYVFVFLTALFMNEEQE